MRLDHIAALLLVVSSCLVAFYAAPTVGASNPIAPRAAPPAPSTTPAERVFLPILVQAAPPAPAPQPLPASHTDGRVAKELARRWASDDAVVANGDQQRRWTWGNAVLSSGSEPWAEAPGGTRAVWYFAKARMEITNPAANSDDPSYVSSGLLVNELIGGFVRTGNATLTNLAPAHIAVVGDVAPDQTVTYADLQPVATLGDEHRSTPRPNAVVVEALAKGGTVIANARFGAYNVRLGTFHDGKGHNIASVFTDAIALDQLLRLAGQPLSEPYWITVPVAGTPTDVLIQAFERRMIMYTPRNAPAARVDWGDVGQQYAQWRYGSASNITPFDPRTILDVQRAPRALNELSPGAVQAANSRTSTEGVAVLNMHTGDLFTYNGNTRFSMYSTVKYPIMLTLLDQAMRAGRQLTADEDALVKKMIQQSDNNATSELYFRRIGGEAAVEAFLRKHSINGIDMNPNYWGLSTTTAPDMARLMGKLGNCTMLNRAWCDYAIDVLRHVDQSQYWGVSAGVPNVYTTRTVALKNGWYPESSGWAINSVGWVKDNGKLYGIAVYTRPSSTMDAGVATVESISRNIYPAVPPR